MATLLTRLDTWFECFVAYAEARGGTMGFNSQGFRDLAAQRENSSSAVIEVEAVDGRPVIRRRDEQPGDT